MRRTVTEVELGPQPLLGAGDRTAGQARAEHGGQDPQRHPGPEQHPQHAPRAARAGGRGANSGGSASRVTTAAVRASMTPKTRVISRRPMRWRSTGVKSTKTRSPRLCRARGPASGCGDG